MRKALSLFENWTVVVATGNGGKSREVMEILKKLGIRAVTLESLGFRVINVRETADCYTDIAQQKTQSHYRRYRGALMEHFGHDRWIILCEDSGLGVDALSHLAPANHRGCGWPGLHTKRWHKGTDANRCRALLEKMAGLENRDARFYCAIAVIGPQFPHGIDIPLGVARGSITSEERGKGGFGYDTIFVPEDDDRTFAEMPPQGKDAYSARAVALGKFALLLKELAPRQASHYKKI